MAMKPTIFRARIQVADMDRSFYADLSLTIPQHPSETDERTMVRLLAFVLNAAEGLVMTEGISAEDEPDVWRKNPSGEIEAWIDVGLPDEKRIRKACNRAKQVRVYAYGGRTVQTWWRPIAENLSRHKNLRVIDLPQEATKLLGEMAAKTMVLNCTVQDGQIWIGDSKNNVVIEPELLFDPT
ncbi:MAG: YaeQ family protein [Nitrospinae bacterium]|nr:YaeQ family protein [Nitrospinota bacterium]